MSNNRRKRFGRGQDKGKRNPRTYYAINKQSTDIYRFLSHEDRQRAVAEEGLDPLTAQEFMQFKAEGKAILHEMPRQVRLSETTAPKPEGGSPQLPQLPQAPSYMEAPRMESTETSTGNAVPSGTTEKVTHTAAAVSSIPAPRMQDQAVILTMEQLRKLMTDAIIEGLRQYHAEVGNNKATSGSAGTTIMGEQPTGNRQTHNH